MSGGPRPWGGSDGADEAGGPRRIRDMTWRPGPRPVIADSSLLLLPSARSALFRPSVLSVPGVREQRERDSASGAGTRPNALMQQQASALAIRPRGWERKLQPSGMFVSPYRSAPVLLRRTVHSRSVSLGHRPVAANYSTSTRSVQSATITFSEEYPVVGE